MLVKSFLNFSDVENSKIVQILYEIITFCNLTMCDVKMLESMKKYVPKKASCAKNELQLCCTYGDKHYKKQGEGLRLWFG